jgi:hypothetical protein
VLLELAWLSPFYERLSRRGKREWETLKGLGAHRAYSPGYSSSSLITPTDGTRAAMWGTGHFGTSPIFVQLSGKQLLASMFIMWRLGT